MEEAEALSLQEHFGAGLVDRWGDKAGHGDDQDPWHQNTQDNPAAPTQDADHIAQGERPGCFALGHHTTAFLSYGTVRSRDPCQWR